jgi:hypothetical protein
MARVPGTCRLGISGYGGLHTEHGAYDHRASARLIGIRLCLRYLHPSLWYF